MARLIDANKLKSAVAESFAPYQREWAGTICQIAKVIDEQPTYDVEKVVEELERMRIDESQGCHNVSTVKCNGYKNCEDCILDRAIEIVRKGGVDGKID